MSSSSVSANPNPTVSLSSSASTTVSQFVTFTQLFSSSTSKTATNSLSVRATNCNTPSRSSTALYHASYTTSNAEETTTVSLRTTFSPRVTYLSPSDISTRSRTTTTVEKQTFTASSTFSSQGSLKETIIATSSKSAKESRVMPSPVATFTTSAFGTLTATASTSPSTTSTASLGLQLVTRKIGVPALLASVNIKWNVLSEAVYSGPVLTDMTDIVGFAFRTGWGKILNVDPSYVFLSEVFEYDTRVPLIYDATSSINLYGRPFNLNTTDKLLLSLGLIDEITVAQNQASSSSETKKRQLKDAAILMGGGGSLSSPPLHFFNNINNNNNNYNNNNNNNSTNPPPQRAAAPRSLALELLTTLSFSTSIKTGLSLCFSVVFANMTQAQTALDYLTLQSSTAQQDAALKPGLVALANQIALRSGRGLVAVDSTSSNTTALSVLGTAVDLSSAQVVIITYTSSSWGLFLDFFYKNIIKVIAGTCCIMVFILCMCTWQTFKERFARRTERKKIELAAVMHAMWLHSRRMATLRARIRARFRTMARAMARHKRGEEITALMLLQFAQEHNGDKLSVDEDAIDDQKWIPREVFAMAHIQMTAKMMMNDASNNVITNNNNMSNTRLSSVDNEKDDDDSTRHRDAVAAAALALARSIALEEEEKVAALDKEEIEAAAASKEITLRVAIATDEIARRVAAAAARLEVSNMNAEGVTTAAADTSMTARQWALSKLSPAHSSISSRPSTAGDLEHREAMALEAVRLAQAQAMEEVAISEGLRVSSVRNSVESPITSTVITPTSTTPTSTTAKTEFISTVNDLLRGMTNTDSNTSSLSPSPSPPVVVVSSPSNDDEIIGDNSTLQHLIQSLLNVTPLTPNFEQLGVPAAEANVWPLVTIPTLGIPGFNGLVLNPESNSNAASPLALASQLHSEGKSPWPVPVHYSLGWGKAEEDGGGGGTSAGEESTHKSSPVPAQMRGVLPLRNVLSVGAQAQQPPIRSQLQSLPHMATKPVVIAPLLLVSPYMKAAPIKQQRSNKSHSRSRSPNANTSSSTNATDDAISVAGRALSKPIVVATDNNDTAFNVPPARGATITALTANLISPWGAAEGAATAWLAAPSPYSRVRSISPRNTGGGGGGSKASAKSPSRPKRNPLDPPAAWK